MLLGCVLVYCSMDGGEPLEFCQHLIHLICVDVVVQPCHAVARDILTELIDESLCPLAVAQILVQFGVTVDHLIVTDPQGDVPCLIVCPTVVRGVAHGFRIECFEGCHVLCVVFSCIVVGRGAMPRRAVPDAALSQHRRSRQRRPSPMGWVALW